MTVVLGSGRLPNDVCLVGESPGETEARTGIPFSGKSGQELEWYLSRFGLSQHYFYKTNVSKLYTPGNPDPTDEQVLEWAPYLESELAQCQPKLIIAVGRFAARWFIGNDVIMDRVHGIPHLWRDTVTVLPVIHPASGFYDKDMKAAIMWDFSQVPKLLQSIKRGAPIQYRRDEYEGREQYSDVTGIQFSQYISEAVAHGIEHIGLDTEGYPDNPFSVQISARPGEGVMLRCSQPDFNTGIDALVQWSSALTFVVHNYMYDAEMCRVMGFDMFDCSVVDTMYMIHTIPYLRVKAQKTQNLEFAAYRWCGMNVMSHDELVKDLGTERQIEYLNQVLELDLDKPEPRTELQNNGTIKTTRPWHTHRLAQGILKDIASGKLDKDGNPTDPVARWSKVHKSQRKPVERVLGKMPIGSVGAVFKRDPERAIRYGCADADSTRRLFFALLNEVPR